MNGRVTLVTGGSAGIGRAIARALLNEGSVVVVNGRDESRCRAVLEEWNVGDQADFVTADVSDRSDCDRLIDTIIQRYGTFHVLVNNAGGFIRGPADIAPVHLLTDDAMEYAWVTNVMSTFWCCRKALPTFIGQQWGRIINISSIAGKVGAEGSLTQYVIAKHGLNGLTKMLAVETALHGITANAICPGLVDTEMLQREGPANAAARGMSYDDWLANAVSGSLVKRTITLEEVAALAVLLASPNGSGITGQCISVDGGGVLA